MRWWSRTQPACATTHAWKRVRCRVCERECLCVYVHNTGKGKFEKKRNTRWVDEREEQILDTSWILIQFFLHCSMQLLWFDACASLRRHNKMVTGGQLKRQLCLFSCISRNATKSRLAFYYDLIDFVSCILLWLGRINGSNRSDRRVRKTGKVTYRGDV